MEKFKDLCSRGSSIEKDEKMTLEEVDLEERRGP
jgi:hypothetical protein